MADPVKIAFERRVRIVPIAKLLPTKVLSAHVRETMKYKRIAASIDEVGVIEPLSVAKNRTGYLLLDGHIRLDILGQRGAVEAPCVVADDDESFTYNKRINRLATIQEHNMIVRALDRGVSEEKLARALNVDVRNIRQRRHLLVGISDDVAELLKDKPIGTLAFQKLKKMKPFRQLEVAELMVSANNYTATYVKALLATSKPADLREPEGLGKATGLSTEQMARLEREMASVSEDYKELEASYGDDMLVLVVASGFLERLLSRPEIDRFLAGHYPEFLETFRSIAQAISLDQPSSAAA